MTIYKSIIFTCFQSCWRDCKAVHDYAESEQAGLSRCPSSFSLRVCRDIMGTYAVAAVMYSCFVHTVCMLL